MSEGVGGTGDEAQASADAAPSRYLRRVRSYVKRGGRTTGGQSDALRRLSPRYVIPFANAQLELAAVFGRQAPTILEIGFGMGEATAHIAARMPERNFLACEVHEPGVGSLLRLIEQRGLANVRIVAHDAVEVLQQMVARESLSGVHLFFPDPWHKKRHHKRRLIQPAFVRQLADCLETGGYLHCATDWQEYAEQMLDVLTAEPLLKNTVEQYAPRPDYRPLTKFEQRGLRLGHGVWDLVFRRQIPGVP